MTIGLTNPRLFSSEYAMLITSFGKDNVEYVLGKEYYIVHFNDKKYAIPYGWANESLRRALDPSRKGIIITEIETTQW